MQKEEKKYIIIDFENHRFAAEHGWVTQREYAKEFNSQTLHPKLKKLREQNFLKITFEDITPTELDKKIAARQILVESAVKRELDTKKRLIMDVNNSQVIICRD